MENSVRVASIPSRDVVRLNAISVSQRMISNKNNQGRKHELSREKTNNVVPEQVRQKPACTVIDKGYRLEIFYLCRRGIVLSVYIAKTKALISFAVTA